MLWANRELFAKFTNEEYISSETNEGIQHGRKNKLTEKDLDETQIETRRNELLASKRDAQSKHPAEAEETGKEKEVKEADDDTLGSRKQDSK